MTGSQALQLQLTLLKTDEAVCDTCYLCHTVLPEHTCMLPSISRSSTVVLLLSAAAAVWGPLWGL
jgi:hypothetical protein